MFRVCKIDYKDFKDEKNKNILISNDDYSMRSLYSYNNNILFTMFREWNICLINNTKYVGVDRY